MEWQRRHQRRVDRADKRLRRDITRATDDLTISDAERHRRLQEAGRRRAKVGLKQVKKAERPINRDGGCAVTALTIGTAALGALATWKGTR